MKRLLSLLLAAALTLVMLPQPARAAETKAEALENLIRNTYRSALRRAGRSSFAGYCGTAVNYQTYLLGIDTRVYGCDGNNEFDMYRDMGTTTGGYRVKSYPAGEYTLRSALNEITCDGTQDAYNILVGFQRTKTAAGSIYGHALLIYGILDGMVYFTESYATSLDGQYWGEGAAISVSIDTFCEAYDRWTTFDGIAYFGLKSYADACESWNGVMYAMVPRQVQVAAEPSDPGIHDGAMTEYVLEAGERVKVDALLKTPGGGTWYHVSAGVRSGYVEADSLMYLCDGAPRVSLTDMKMPEAIRRGVGFVVRGTVSSRDALIEKLEIRVWSAEQDTPLFSGEVTGSSGSLSLDTPKLDRDMTFRSLPVGSYRIAVEATLRYNSLKNGSVTQVTEKMEVWNSEFQVVADWKLYPLVAFNGNGGTAEISQTAVMKGQTLGDLPTARREGWIFSGWSFDPEGKQPANAQITVDSAVTLYAQWKKDEAAYYGWKAMEDGRWVYYAGNAPLEGWFTSHGLRFYQNSDGSVLSGWQKLDDAAYYFNAAGAALTGLQTIGGKTYFLYKTGGYAVGWIEQEGIRYFFGTDGTLERTEGLEPAPEGSDTIS